MLDDELQSHVGLGDLANCKLTKFNFTYDFISCVTNEVFDEERSKLGKNLVQLQAVFELLLVGQKSGEAK